MTIASNNLLYIAEAGNHRVSAFNQNGEFQFMFGGEGTNPGQFIRPEDVSFNGKDTLYVADFGNHRIQAFRVHE